MNVNLFYFFAYYSEFFSFSLPHLQLVEADDLEDVDSKDGKSEEKNETPVYIGHKIPEDFLLKAGLLKDDADDDGTEVKPLYSLNADGTVQRMFYIYCSNRPF